MKRVRLTEEEYQVLCTQVQKARTVIAEAEKILSAAEYEAEQIVERARQEANRQTPTEISSEIQIKKIREDFPEIACHFSRQGVYQGKDWYQGGADGSDFSELFQAK